MATANRDEGLKCLDIAKRAFESQDLDKSRRFAEKASRLLSQDEVQPLLNKINSSTASGSGTSFGRQDSREPFKEKNYDNGPNLMRNRKHTEVKKEENSKEDNNKATPEQRETVQRIIRSKDYYEILQVERSCTDDHLKKSYRKLALKLHPDKNKAVGAEDAFKKVSKAFQCLSDPDKREYYNRTGFEDSNARMASSRPTSTYSSEMDAQDLFNMMFGGSDPFDSFFTGSGVRFGSFGPGARYNYRTNRQAPPQGGHQEAQTTRGFSTLIQILPLILFLLLSLFSSFGGFMDSPDHSLQRTRFYSTAMETQRKHVEFFVQSQESFNAKYQPDTRARQRLERSIEEEYKQYLVGACQRELQDQSYYQHYYGARGKKQTLRNCEELKKTFEEYQNKGF